MIGGYSSADGKLKFDSVWACTDGNCTFHVIFASSISGYISGNVYDLERRLSAEKPAPLPLRQPEAIYPSFLNHLKPQEAERRRRLPGVLLGMVKMEVLASAWGEPERKEETRTSSYHKEKWLYPDGTPCFSWMDGWRR